VKSNLGVTVASKLLFFAGDQIKSNPGVTLIN